MDPFHRWLMSWYLLSYNSVDCNFNSNELIRSKRYTCHDNSAVAHLQNFVPFGCFCFDSLCCAFSVDVFTRSAIPRSHMAELCVQYYKMSAQIITMTSYWAWWHLKPPASRLFTQLFFFSGAHQRKHQSSPPLALWGEFIGEFPS